MRVLVLAHRVPYPPNKGEKIRLYHLLRGLLARGHRVRLLAFADDPRDLGHGRALAELGLAAEIVPLNRYRALAGVLLSLTGRTPLSVAYFDAPAMRQAVARTLAKAPFEAVLVHSAPMVQYVSGPLVARTVLDLVDADSQKWADLAGIERGPRSWLYRLEANRLRRYEHALIERFPRTVFSHRGEVAALGRSAAEPTLAFVDNGVEPGPPPVESSRVDQPTQLAFVGVMNYRPNVDGVRWFADRALPLIWAERPEVELVVVGRDPAPAIRQLGRRPGIVVTGEVADPRPYLDRAAVVVVPLRVARGVQNKLLEALAAGRATVASSGAVEGLRVVDGEHLVVADTPAEQAAAVLRLLADAQARARLGANARALVEREYRWEPRQASLAALLEAVTPAATGAPG
jgi:sugar transferase (PEP-CTERM/EpsH1 system associated)